MSMNLTAACSHKVSHQFVLAKHINSLKMHAFTYLKTAYTAEIWKSCYPSCETADIISNFVDVVQVITGESKPLQLFVPHISQLLHVSRNCHGYTLRRAVQRSHLFLVHDVDMINGTCFFELFHLE